MPHTTYTDLRHYLNEDGSVPEHARPAMNAFRYAAAIVAWVTRTPSLGLAPTNVFCRRSYHRAQCKGEIVAAMVPANADVYWRCPACGEEGYISGWAGSAWDRSDEAELGPMMN